MPGDLPDLQADGSFLVVDCCIMIPFIQLVYAEDTSNEHCQGGKAEHGQQEPPSSVEPLRHFVDSLSAPVVAQCVLCSQNNDQHWGDDLEGETGQVNLHAHMRGALGLGGHRSTCGLQDKGDNTARDEDLVV